MDGDNGHDREAKRAAANQKYEELLGPLLKDGGSVIYDFCPNCKSTTRVFQTFYEFLVSQGRMPPGSFACSSVNKQVFTGQLGTQLVGAKVVGVLIYRDICTVCGLEYPVKITREDAVLQSVQMGRK